MTTLHSLCFLAALLTGVAACASEAPRAAPADSPVVVETARLAVAASSAAAGAATPPPADLPALPCPSPKFAGFLAVFAERPDLQRRFTRFPLAYAAVEDGPDEPVTVERPVPADSAPEPLFPSAEARARSGLEVEVDSARAERRVASVFKPDTDARIEYTFERQADGCWLLTRYDDQSL